MRRARVVGCTFCVWTHVATKKVKPPQGAVPPPRRWYWQFRCAVCGGVTEFIATYAPALPIAANRINELGRSVRFSLPAARSVPHSRASSP